MVRRQLEAPYLLLFVINFGSTTTTFLKILCLPVMVLLYSFQMALIFLSCIIDYKTGIISSIVTIDRYGFFKQGIGSYAFIYLFLKNNILC